MCFDLLLVVAGFGLLFGLRVWIAVEMLLSVFCLYVEVLDIGCYWCWWVRCKLAFVVDLLLEVLMFGEF